jgi:hypothetical protein
MDFVTKRILSIEAQHNAVGNSGPRAAIHADAAHCAAAAAGRRHRDGKRRLPTSTPRQARGVAEFKSPCSSRVSQNCCATGAAEVHVHGARNRHAVCVALAIVLVIEWIRGQTEAVLATETTKRQCSVIRT